MNEDKFEVLNNNGKPLTTDEIDKLAKEGGLFDMDIDQFYIGQDGSIILADDCGNMTYLDKDKYIIRMIGRYPDLEYLEAVLMGNIMHNHPEARGNVYMRDTSVDMFPQTWPNTAGGFDEPGKMSGQAFTTEYTTVIKISLFLGTEMNNRVFYGIFFGNKPAYLIENPPEIFFEDLKSRQMKTKYEAEKVY